jgi:hypothetical protein
MYTGGGKVDPNPEWGKTVNLASLKRQSFPFTNVPGEGHSVSTSLKQKTQTPPLPLKDLILDIT